MRAFTIKHKGATILQNMTMEFHQEHELYIGIIFFRRKDAIKYLNTFEYKKFYEVIGLTIDKSNKDNRKRS